MRDFSLSDVRLFTKAVELGGLSHAADVLKVPKASASRQLQRLEATLGHVLLHRGSTRFALTEEGSAFLSTAQTVLAALDQTLSNLSFEGDAVTGRLRIAMANGVDRDLLALHLPGFMALYPNLEISIESCRDTVDLFRDEADVAIRCGREGCEEMVARRLRTEPMVLCAAPAYLAQHPEIHDLPDLARHFFLTTETQARDKAIMLCSTHGIHRIRGHGVLRSNDPEFLVKLAVVGKGIALIPQLLVARQLDEQALVAVLPELGLSPREINLLYVPGRRNAPKIKVFVDYMRDVFRQM
ncbi:LysR family transcriptional regulator [Variovorax sp. PAMC 28711]|uniref:LysR family transcriptional regulator n=1 Tax=Variovorax sp. PAMC 28711 TaxID=1795631 RepID=UPI00078E6D0D|nr:LysR family transcriptional regulator [Variovorax sp. PAMC 28711]AMM25983.1 LysR family transcriptional regulator [Variovorax sp. PAMC 28711]